MVGVGAAGLVPIAFVDGNHFAGVAGDAAVGKEVGRVGEDEVEGVVGDVLEDFETIAVVEAELVFGIVVGDMGLEEGVVRGVGGGEFGHFLVVSVPLSVVRKRRELFPRHPVFRQRREPFLVT